MSLGRPFRATSPRGAAGTGSGAGAGPAATSGTLALRSVSKRFSASRPAVVDDVCLKVGPGELLAVMGRSGCGKSTLLKIAAGLVRPTSGTVSWQGEQLQALSLRRLARLRRSDFAVVHQDYNLLPALSVAENVELSARLDGRRLGRARIAEVLDAVGLGGRERARPGELSGGEQQRVALARALAVEVQVLFADEPTGALDAGSRDLVLGQIADLVADGRRRVVMVTHDPWVAARAHRVVFMSDGRITSELASPSVEEITARVGQGDAVASS